jgi:hypothetical protein
MNMNEYAWSFGPPPPIGSNDKSSFRNLHAEFRSYLIDLQTSEFFKACSYFNLKIQIDHNGKEVFSLFLDKTKFTLTEVGTISGNKSICLERFSNPPCTPESLIACINMFKMTSDDVATTEEYDSFIEALRCSI